MTVGAVVEEFLIYYADALKKNYIRKPVSWALYQTWKWADVHEAERKEDK